MNKELREILCQSLYREMEGNNKIVSIGADLNKANGLLPLKKAFPQRTLNVGVAEQNMAGIAAGMASYGMIPIISTFAAFASRRICDIVAVSICYSNSNVKIIGTDPGIAAELNGGTHMAFEDIGVLRSIPNITILEPADGVELAQMVPAAINHCGPVYIRMYRKNIPDVHDSTYEYKLGKADILRDGKDVTIICSGIMVYESLKAAKELFKMGIDAEVMNIHTLKPIDDYTIINSARKTGAVITAENHNILGGLRSAVSEVITEVFPVRIYPIGIKDIKGEVGKLSYLKQRFGLTSEEIIKTAKRAIADKK